MISDGTTAAQQVLVSTLGDVAARAAAAGVRPPAVVVVGDVVGLRDQLLADARAAAGFAPGGLVAAESNSAATAAATWLAATA